MSKLAGAKLWEVEFFGHPDNEVWVAAQSAQKAIPRAIAFAKDSYGWTGENLVVYKVKFLGTVDA